MFIFAMTGTNSLISISKPLGIILGLLFGIGAAALSISEAVNKYSKTKRTKWLAYIGLEMIIALSWIVLLLDILSLWLSISFLLIFGILRVLFRKTQGIELVPRPPRTEQTISIIATIIIAFLLFLYYWSQ